MKMFEEYMDDFADEDLNKLTKAESKTLEAINKKIKENFDPRIKTVGDRVLIWDSSRLTNYDTDEPITDPMEERILANYPSIVIDDRQRYEAKVVTLAGDFTKILDLKVWNKNLNKVYRTASEFVKIV